MRNDGTRHAVPVKRTKMVHDHRLPIFSMVSKASGKAGSSTAHSRKKLKKSFLPKFVAFRVRPKYATAMADLQTTINLNMSDEILCGFNDTLLYFR